MANPFGSLSDMDGDSDSDSAASEDTRDSNSSSHTTLMEDASADSAVSSSEDTHDSRAQPAHSGSGRTTSTTSEETYPPWIIVTHHPVQNQSRAAEYTETPARITSSTTGAPSPHTIAHTWSASTQAASVSHVQVPPSQTVCTTLAFNRGLTLSSNFIQVLGRFFSTPIPNHTVLDGPEEIDAHLAELNRDI